MRLAQLLFLDSLGPSECVVDRNQFFPKPVHSHRSRKHALNWEESQCSPGNDHLKGWLLQRGYMHIVPQEPQVWASRIPGLWYCWGPRVQADHTVLRSIFRFEQRNAFQVIYDCDKVLFTKVYLLLCRI